MTIIQALILAIVEGITEFLPVSSTGHMIISSSFMGIASDPFTKLFTVCIQFGAILSVVVLYFKRFFKGLNFYLKLLAGFIPTAIAGLLLGDWIDSLLENVLVVAITLLAGGIVLLFVDKWFAKNEEDESKELSYKKAGFIGTIQSVAMIPGVSRSAATIVGGLLQGLNRKAAAEFSFFLAVPTMFAATAKKILDYYQDGQLTLSSEQWSVLAIGNLAAFIVAMLAIRSFIGFLTKYGFKAFGYYRIAVGAILLILLSQGIDLKIV